MEFDLRDQEVNQSQYGTFELRPSSSVDTLLRY